MFVSEQRVLSLGVGAARARLADLVRDGWLGAVAEAAYGDGADHLLRAGRLDNPPGLAQRVQVQFLDPVDRDDSVTVGMRWLAVGVTGDSFPVLDADIRLAAHDQEGTRVTLTGVYRPPPGAVGAGIDRTLLHRVASTTVGFLLTRMAQALAGTIPAAAKAGAPTRWPVGPETRS